MTNDEKEIKRKLRILQHAEYSGNIAKTCRYFGVVRSVFYLWRNAYREFGEAGLKRKRPAPKSHPRRTPPEIEEKVLYLRRQYHLGSIRIMWYMERYLPCHHDIRVHGDAYFKAKWFTSSSSAFRKTGRVHQAIQ